MNKTGIEYLTHTWNPLAMRCAKISEGCDNCWHLRMADRLAKNPTLSGEKRKAYSGTVLDNAILDKKQLSAPLHIKKPSVIGVQFMGDLFHMNLAPEFVAAVFGVMAFCPQHTFIVLTKRPSHMRKFFYDFHGGHYQSNLNWWKNEACSALPFGETFGIRLKASSNNGEPLKNVWIGVTVENQARADERIPILLQIPAAVRFVSVEPMLGPVDPFNAYSSDLGYHGGTIDWVICGGESGPGARPMEPDWARRLRDQCVDAGVPFFFKQWGKYPPFKIGNEVAGQSLDGQEWRQMPEVCR